MIANKTYLYGDPDRDRLWLNGQVREILVSTLYALDATQPVPTVAHGMFPYQCLVRIGDHVIAVAQPRPLDLMADTAVFGLVVTLKAFEGVRRNSVLFAHGITETGLVVVSAYDSTSLNLPLDCLSYLTEEHLAQLARSSSL